MRIELPRVAQTLDTTCGAACFASMFEYFTGLPQDFLGGDLRFARELGTLELGYTPPAKIADLARSYGFECVFLEAAALEDLREQFARPAVVFVTWWDEDAGHYSLVKFIDQTQIVLMDPWAAREGGDTCLDIEEFETNWRARGARLIAVSRSLNR